MKLSRCVLSEGALPMLQSRRFWLFRQAPLLLAAGALRACRTAKKASSTPPVDPRLPAPPSKGEVQAVEPIPVLTPPSPTQAVGEPCTTTEGLRVELTRMAQATELFEANLLFYGSRNSTLIVLDLPRYIHGNLADIYLVRASGELLAHCGINDMSDVREDRRLRPLVFDGLRLKNENRLHVVFHTIEEKFSQYAMRENIRFEDTFEGKRVYGLTPESVPDALFAKNTLSPAFAIDASFYQHIKEADKLLNAARETPFRASEDLRNFIVTDLMGNVLARYGEVFADITLYPHFICYRLLEEAYYLRTFVRLV